MPASCHIPPLPAPNTQTPCCSHVPLEFAQPFLQGERITWLQRATNPFFKRWVARQTLGQVGQIRQGARRSLGLPPAAVRVARECHLVSGTMALVSEGARSNKRGVGMAEARGLLAADTCTHADDSRWPLDMQQCSGVCMEGVRACKAHSPRQCNLAAASSAHRRLSGPCPPAGT
jgi:hypothetical protein